jgi:putative membrane-bound dehydrogenase-like protein
VAGSIASAASPKVPDGFETRLVATVPAVLYPCQLATAPDGALFVAEDPMDQVGPYESKNGRILLFRDGKEPIVFADGFRAIFGMAWYEGSLYVSHMPFLTVLRDTNGDGKADERKDLFKDLGPTNNQGLNDHIVSGLQFGMDGYLYISTGDKGVPKATGPDGRTIQIVGGGTFRCRPDGTGLEVVSTGTRNHLDPNLDDRDNLFTYDNTDDGDGWWTRVTHHVDGGYYGYPYDYHHRADRMLPRMAEYGGGSPCGAVVYKEDVWPEKYRGIALWAEWGKGKVQAFRFVPDGATFKIGETFDFVSPGDTREFRPIDLALSYDGRTLYVADWGMGGWGSKTEKVGRVFAVSYTGKVETRPRGNDGDPIPALIKQLDHPSFNERMRAQRALIKRGDPAQGPAVIALFDTRTPALARRHLVWVVDGVGAGSEYSAKVLVRALRLREGDLRGQAARALGERKVKAAVGPLVALLGDPDPTVRLQATIALGRIGDRQAIPTLVRQLADKDVYIAFSTRQALRRINDWKSASSGLAANDEKVRAATMAAMEMVYERDAVAALAQFVADPKWPAAERGRALTYLAEGHHKTKPWDGRWWGTRPTQGKPPAKEVAWAGTDVVLKTIRERLSDAEAPIRLAAVSAVRETRYLTALASLRERFPTEPDAEVRVELARTFAALDDKAAVPLLVAVLHDSKSPEALRDAALKSVEKIGSDVAIRALTELVEKGTLTPERESGVIAALGRARAKPAIPVLVRELKNSTPTVRAAAAEALGQIDQADGVAPSLRPLLADRVPDVREATIKALGALEDRESIAALLKLADAQETRFAATLALAAMPDDRALQVYLRGLGDKNQELREASARAINKIRDSAAPILDQLANRHELSPTLIPELKKIYAASKPVTGWRILGPFDAKAPSPVSPTDKIDANAKYKGVDGKELSWRRLRRPSRDGSVDLARICGDGNNVAALGYAEIISTQERPAQLALGSDDTLTVWLNGTQVYDFQSTRGFEPEQAKVDIKLAKGTNRLLVRCGNLGGPWIFAIVASAVSDHAFLKAPEKGGFNPEHYREVAMKGQGKPDRGKALFSDLKGLACIKCHSVGGKGGSVGPELASVGAKYPREELINSVLNPSARIFSGYEQTSIATADGRVINGIVKSDTADAIEIEDADAKRTRIPKSEIDAQKKSDVSLMPTGLAQGLTAQDFADVIAYLETLKDTQPAKPAAGGGR